MGIPAFMRKLCLSPRRAVTGLAIAATLLLGGDGVTEGSFAALLVTSNLSQGRDPAVLERLLGKAKCEKLPETRAEVWTVPQTQIDRLKQQLVSWGIKFALLREDWNHILKRDEAPMSRAQEEALATLKRSPETLGITLTSAPKAAVAEYALTGRPEDRNSRILIPISDGQQVAIVRDQFVRTDQGLI